MDLNVVATGHGQKAINSGLLATKAHLAAEVFHPVVLGKMAQEDGGMSHLTTLVKQLACFPFVSAGDTEGMLLELSDLVAHVLLHPDLPSVDVKDEVTMQKGSDGKRAIARARILRRRRLASAAAEVDVDVVDPTAVELPDPLPNCVKALREEAPRFNEEACAVMEWWRRLTTTSGAGMPRHQAFPAWGKVLRKVALCCPSSASAERVFSLLKHVLGDLEYNKHADKVEATMLLLFNDIDV